MIAKIISWTLKPSKNGGCFYYIVFEENNTKKLFYSYLCPTMKNFSRWAKVMNRGTILKGLKLKKNTLINADSHFIEVKNTIK